MYIPSYSEIKDLKLIHQFVTDHSFGLLINQVDGEPSANHFPFLLDTSGSSQEILWTHMARSNPQWQQLKENSKCLAVFHGPHAYVSPNFYQEKLNVPTWNYTAVHAQGVAEIIEDAAGIEDVLVKSVQHFEGGNPSPWKYELPEDFKKRLITAIVAVKLTVIKWEAKFKLSQNRSSADYDSVIKAFENRTDDNSRELLGYMKLTKP